MLSLNSWHTTRNARQTYRPGESPSETSCYNREPSPVIMKFPVVSVAPSTGLAMAQLDTVYENPNSPAGLSGNVSIHSGVLAGIVLTESTREKSHHEGEEAASPVEAQTQRSSVSDFMSIITLPSFVHHDRSGSYSSSRHAPNSPRRASESWSPDEIPPVPQLPSSLLTGLSAPSSSTSGRSRDRAFVFPHIPKNITRISLPGSSKRRSSSSLLEPKIGNSGKRSSEPAMKRAVAEAEVQEAANIEEGEREWERIRAGVTPGPPKLERLDERDITEAEAAIQSDFDSPLPSYTANYVRPPQFLPIAVTLPPSPTISYVATSSNHEHQPSIPSSSASHGEVSDGGNLDPAEAFLDNALPPVYRVRDTLLHPTHLESVPTASAVSESFTPLSGFSNRTSHSFSLSLHIHIPSTVRPLPVVPPPTGRASLDSRSVSPPISRSRSATITSISRALPTLPIPSTIAES